MSIREDIQTVFDKDPAARSTLEVLLCYPGLHAIWAHRIAHALYRRRLYFLARLVSHIAGADRDRDPPRREDRPPGLHDHGSGVDRGDRRSGTMS